MIIAPHDNFYFKHYLWIWEIPTVWLIAIAIHALVNPHCGWRLNAPRQQRHVSACWQHAVSLKKEVQNHTGDMLLQYCSLMFLSKTWTFCHDRTGPEMTTKATKSFWKRAWKSRIISPFLWGQWFKASNNAFSELDPANWQGRHSMFLIAVLHMMFVLYRRHWNKDRFVLSLCYKKNGMYIYV